MKLRYVTLTCLTFDAASCSFSTSRYIWMRHRARRRVLTGGPAAADRLPESQIMLYNKAKCAAIQHLMSLGSAGFILQTLDCWQCQELQVPGCFYPGKMIEHSVSECHRKCFWLMHVCKTDLNTVRNQKLHVKALFTVTQGNFYFYSTLFREAGLQQNSWNKKQHLKKSHIKFESWNCIKWQKWSSFFPQML